jgi:hypothetical protein
MSGGLDRPSHHLRPVTRISVCLPRLAGTIIGLPQFLNNNLRMAVGLSRCGQREETVAPNSSATSHSIATTTATITRGATNDVHRASGDRERFILPDGPIEVPTAKQAAVTWGCALFNVARDEQLPASAKERPWPMNTRPEDQPLRDGKSACTFAEPTGHSPSIEPWMRAVSACASMTVT